MKPTQMFEKTKTPAESVQTEVRGNKTSRKIVYMIVGVVAFVLVVSAVLLSVYFGMKMAKDNYKGLLTVKIVKSGFSIDGCYVANMNYSDFQTPTEFTSTHTASQITFETKNKITRVYDVTDVWLNSKALGQRSAELCKEKVVYFLRENRGIRVEKSLPKTIYTGR